MRSVLGLVTLAALAMLGCGGGNPPCFTPKRGVDYLNSDAIFVANTGSSSISAFQTVDFTPGYSDGGVCGSPFPMSAPPTALGGGLLSDAGLAVVSQTQKSLSLYPVDLITSVLSAPLFTMTTHNTPAGVASVGLFFYVANVEGSVSAFQASENGAVSELAGSPYPAGSGPVAIVASVLPDLLYVANSQSNNISGYSQDPSTGVLTPLPGSPYPAGDGPASIVIAGAPVPSPFGPRLVMVANRLSNNVSVFSVAGDGSLSPVPGSPFPLGGAPSSVGIATNLVPLKFAYVTIPALNEIAGFSIDEATGALTPLAGSPFSAGLEPWSAAVAPYAATEYLFVANKGSNSMSVYSIDQNSGALTPVSGSPFPVGQSPTAVLYFQVPQ
jgi:6-phosphogluconolactonase